MWIIDRIKKERRQINERCSELLTRVETAIKEYEAMFSDVDEYIEFVTADSWRNENSELFGELNDALFYKLKKAKEFKILTRKTGRLLLAEKELDSNREKHNSRLGERLAGDVYRVIGEVEGKILDTQQLVAISKQVHTHLVLAGAGTGKTTTIVGLVKYLLLSKRFKSDEILVLSFTNASATEMKGRIHKETGIPVETSTFHKLGINIISEVNGVKPKISQLQQRSFIKQQLESLMLDSAYIRKLNTYFLRSQCAERSEFDFSSFQEYQDYLEKNPPVTLKKERVKSYGELEIANCLYLSGVEYVYEKPYKTDTRSKEFGQYKPDFYLPEFDIYIEYFGINRSGKPPAYFKGDYVASMEWKRKLHKDNHTTMIESFAYENFEGTLITSLENRLKEKGVVFKPLSEEEVWEKITKENGNVVSGLVQLIETVINLMKSNKYDIPEMRSRNVLNGNLPEISHLLDVISPIWDRYNTYLAESEEIDFNDMINNAADYVRSGNYVNRYKMVIVDEYQDISKARYELLKALKDSSDYDLFCVGDDWQSIYQFSGSDIGYIQRFSDYWEAAEISRIETTYRFSQRLIDITSSFIMRDPKQLRKSIRGVEGNDEYVLGEIQGYTEKYAVGFMIEKLTELPQGSSVFLIGRYTNDSKMLEENINLSFRYNAQSGIVDVSYYKRQDLKISFITAHKSKGLQADYVFILNNKQGKLGFPSKIQDSPILSLMLEGSDTFPDAEERRLFYVAMTRAKRKVWLVTLKDNKSEFAEELISEYGEEIRKEAFSCPLCGGRLVRKSGRFGEFYGCSNYSTTGCRFTRNVRKRKSERED